MEQTPPSSNYQRQIAESTTLVTSNPAPNPTRALFTPSRRTHIQTHWLSGSRADSLTWTHEQSDTLTFRFNHTQPQPSSEG
eukprot:1366267-Pyramimonas_sp.AAC.1